MKKLIAAFLVAVIALTLAACASEQQNSDVPSNTQSEAPTSTPAPDESDTAIFAATEGTWRLDGEKAQQVFIWMAKADLSPITPAAL